MGSMDFSLSEEYLSDYSYVLQVKSDISALGVEWNKVQFTNNNLEHIPEYRGIFLLIFEDILIEHNSSPVTKNIVYVGGNGSPSLRQSFLELINAFEHDGIHRNLYSNGLLRFDVRRQKGELFFYYLLNDKFSNELVEVILQKLKTAYSPPGNRVHRIILDHANIEPAF